MATLSTPHLEHVSAAVLAAFDGTPAAPQPFIQHPDYANYDVQIHSRDPATWQTLEPMAAQHGADCSGPPASHQNTSYEGSVFVCNAHVMTALNTSGYGVIYLTPNRMIPSASSGSVSFELSTQRMSQRDWWDIMISPYANQQALPLLSDLSQDVDLQGPSPNAIHIGADNGQGAPVLKVVRNGAIERYGSGETIAPLNQGIVAGTNQAAVRQSFKFTIANGRMKFERLASATAPALVYWDVAATATWTGPAIVQFGHHSYTPTKDNSGVPGTWHWDEITIPNGTPFSILHAAPRILTAPGTVTFPSAPAGAALRFSALCRPVVNGTPATRQPFVGSLHAEHASSYFVPIPAGSTSATIAFANDDWYTTGFPCHAKDFHVWSLAGGNPATNTPTPGITATQTPLPTATNTAVPPTGTPASTSTPLPTGTPAATSTPTPIATSCEVRVRIGGTEQWLVKPSAFCEASP